jgi:sodium-dependent dicarboxylate transporter 2/3/5
VVALTVFMSELTSNTAQVATMLPILAALAPVLDVPPALLLVPCTLAASLAFMMPVGTPPNAIVFGTGLLTIPDMVRAGFRLNLAGILVITALAYAVIGPLLVKAEP